MDGNIQCSFLSNGLDYLSYFVMAAFYKCAQKKPERNFFDY
ncbi:MAG: hypothetical protein RHS_5305 [Robinsoniella sp. RHS]|nr:MAG: hypothetical protein RHS_5305 [Robinsoniella sp. RHS]